MQIGKRRCEFSLFVCGLTDTKSLFAFHGCYPYFTLRLHISIEIASEIVKVFFLA